MIKMEKKRLYIGLLGICILFLSGLIYYIWKLAFSQEYIYRLFFAILLVIFVLLVIAAGLGALGLVISLISGKNPVLSQRLVTWTLNIFYPIIMKAGKYLSITQERIQRSFIEVNNRLVETRKIKLPASKLLVILPHCLQQSDCPHKVTGAIENCKGCGKCSIGELKRVSEKFSVSMEIVPGGTLARRAVKKHKPATVLAVACERDLSSGIMDRSPRPVYGIINERPLGPCYNTSVNIGKLEEAIKSYLEGVED